MSRPFGWSSPGRARRHSLPGRVPEGIARGGGFVGERLDDPSGNSALVVDGQLDGVEERPSVLGPPCTFGADTAPVRAEPGAAAPGHHEVDAVADVMVEGKPMSTDEQAHVVGPQQVEELLFALLKPRSVWGA